MGETLPGQFRKQSDELLSGAKERGIDPTQGFATILREAAERRRQMLKAPKKLNEVLQEDFTDYTTEDGEKYRIGCITEYLSRFNLVSEVLDTETGVGFDSGDRAGAQRDRRVGP